MLKMVECSWRKVSCVECGAVEVLTARWGGTQGLSMWALEGADGRKRAGSAFIKGVFMDGATRSMKEQVYLLHLSRRRLGHL